MRHDEPLEGWLFQAKLRAEREPSPYQRRAGGEALDRLAQALAAQPEGKVNYDKIRGGTISVYATHWFSADEAADAQALYLQVWERGGAGSSHIAEGLLQSIALALQPASVPFWRQLLDLSRPRDQSTTRRRTMALAGLALLAIERDTAEAYAALADALSHPHEQVRALAAFYLAEAYAVPERELPPPVAELLVRLATSDRAFASRFQARAALRTLGRPVPHDDPELIYFLKVQLRGDRATRTLAVLPEHTLSDLHYAIQRAFDWDSDHLYSFYLNGRDDRLYEIRCPELDPGWDFGVSLMTIVDGRGKEATLELPPADEATAEDEEEEEDEDEALYTTNVQLGALGLVPKHQFIYFFDYGDSHEFVVTVLGIETRADDGDYPRVIEAKGKAPRQYHSWDEDDGDDES